jgi:hypothetical protein
MAVPTEASGRTSLGKYTLFTRFPLSTTDLADRLRELLNRFHASRPDSRYTGKSGTPRGRITANTSVNTPR